MARPTTIRSTSFANTRWEPSGPTLALRKTSVAGPFGFMNPTTAIYDIRSNSRPGGHTADLADITNVEKQERAKIRWNARDYRKGMFKYGHAVKLRLILVGRHVLLLPRDAPLAARLQRSSSARSILLGIGRMFIMFPYWDVSWLIGICFTIGCLIFVACGLFYWLPIAYPATAFPYESSVAGGVSAFVGATLFQIGAVLLFLESYNDRAETKFGGALEDLFVNRLGIARRVRNHRPKHINAGDLPQQQPLSAAGGDRRDSSNANDNSSLSASSGHSAGIPCVISHGDRGYDDTFEEREWQWWPSWHDVTTHYIYEIGFLASLTMSIGATIFYICGILALPGIYANLSKAAIQGAYYFPYLFGGILFALSSALYILETQPNWYTPQPYKIGWHVGVWNMIGGIGWTLAASFGYCEEQHWCKYQSELTLIWASMAFSFGSALQWYESLDKYVLVIED